LIANHGNEHVVVPSINKPDVISSRCPRQRRGAAEQAGAGSPAEDSVLSTSRPCTDRWWQQGGRGRGRYRDVHKTTISADGHLVTALRRPIFSIFNAVVGHGTDAGTTQ